MNGSWTSFPPQFSTSLFPVFIFPCSLLLLSLSASTAVTVKLILFPKPFILFSCPSVPLVFLNLYYYFRLFFYPLQFLSFLYLIPFISVSVYISKIHTRGRLLLMSFSFRFLRYLIVGGLQIDKFYASLNSVTYSHSKSSFLKLPEKVTILHEEVICFHL